LLFLPWAHFGDTVILGIEKGTGTYGFRKLIVAEKNKNCPLRICDCGLADYRQVLKLQYQLHEERCQGKIANTVLIVEHHPVITLGARQNANKLLAGRSTLAQKQIDIVNIRRGGGTTAHNLGQLVFYPILHLQDSGFGISEYIRELEAIGAELLKQYLPCLQSNCHDLAPPQSGFSTNLGHR